MGDVRHASSNQDNQDIDPNLECFTDCLGRAGVTDCRDSCNIDTADPCWRACSTATLDEFAACELKALPDYVCATGQLAVWQECAVATSCRDLRVRGELGDSTPSAQSN